MDRETLRRDSSHGTQPAGMERADGEVRHDAPLRLLVELRDHGKARQGKARQGKNIVMRNIGFISPTAQTFAVVLHIA